jgi:hypothetical protein
MTSRFVSSLLAALALATIAASAEAQTPQLHFGPHLSYNLDIEELGLGAQLSVPIARHIEFYPSFDWYLVPNGSLVGLNADLKFRTDNTGGNWLYFGGGLNVTSSNPDGGSSRSDTRANLFVGIESRSGRVHPFAELRGMLGDRSSTQFAAGLNFTMGSP